MESIAVSVGARAALAGNPSDGFDGAVVSAVLPFFAATATTTTAKSASGIDLVEAAHARFAESVTSVGEVGVEVASNIPQSVGLAGSSAIVVATLRALDLHLGTGLEPMAIAELAHTVERVDLGIAGGWQDQLIQSHGVSALVECGEPRRVLPLALTPDRPIELYLAYSEEVAESSGTTHQGLRAAARPGDPAMVELADLARTAAEAIAAGDIVALAAAIDATFDVRRRIMDIAPAQVAMVESARELGACANFAGSGGAIVGLLPAATTPFINGLAGLGYEVRTWMLT